MATPGHQDSLDDPARAARDDRQVTEELVWLRRCVLEYLTVRDLRTEPGRVWTKLAEEEMVVVTNRGRPQALMLDVDGSTLQETVEAVRVGRAVRAVAAMRERSAAMGLDRMTMEEIDAEIAAARAERHAR